MTRKRNLFCYLMVAPTLFVTLVIGVYPVIDTIRISFLQYDFLRLVKEGTPFVGVTNYVTIFSNPLFPQAILNTLLFGVFVITGVIFLGLLVSQILNQEFRGRGIARTLTLMPWFIPPVVASGIWVWLYQPERSPFNFILLTTGIIQSNIRFLFDMNWMLGPISIPFLSIVVVRVWNSLPFTITFLLAGLQSVSKEMYEAADIDGASAISKFFFLTIPLLKPVLSVIVALIGIGAIGHFEINFIMTDGGPKNLTSTMAVIAYQQAYSHYRYDYAAAISVVILLLSSAVGYFYIKSRLKEV